MVGYFGNTAQIFGKIKKIEVIFVVGKHV